LKIVEVPSESVQGYPFCIDEYFDANSDRICVNTLYSDADAKDDGRFTQNSSALALKAQIALEPSKVNTAYTLFSDSN